MTRPFRFGAVLRLAESGKEWADKARSLEADGFSTLLVPDHLVGPRLAPIAAMTAAACATTRLRVGTLVFANDFRHPAVLAKEAATLDLLSDGRLELGLGTGWMARDYTGAGLPLDPPGVRVARLEESLRVMKTLWRGGPAQFSGTHYRLDGLDQSPLPISPGGPRIMLGGGGPKMLALAAREADIVNLTMRVRADGAGPDLRDSGLDQFREKVGVLREAAGERFENLELGTSVLQLGVGASPAEWSAANPSAQVGTPQVLVGSVDEICDTLRGWRAELGISYFVLHNEGDLAAFRPVVARLAEV